MRDVWKDIERREIHNKPQESSAVGRKRMRYNEVQEKNFPLLMDGYSNKQILETATISSSSWSPFR